MKLCAVGVALMFAVACSHRAPPPAEPTPPAAGSDAMATPTPAPTPTPSAGADMASPITTEAEYDRRGTAMLDGIFAIFASAGTDCDQIADQIETFHTAHAAVIDSLNAYEKVNPEAPQGFRKTAEAQMKKIGEKVEPVMKNCHDNEKFKAAIGKLG